MKKHFLLLLMMAMLPLATFAVGTLHGTTQYQPDGFKYKILSIYKNLSGANQNTVSISQNVYATNGAAAMVIPATVEIYVKGTDDSSTPKNIDEKITFKVVEIEPNAFQGVTKATSVQIGSNVATIGAGAFDGCSKVTSITFDANNNDVAIEVNAFKGTKVTELDLTPIKGTMPYVKKWFNNTAFTPGTESKKNTYLETIKFPEQLTTIDADAFAGFTKLKNVVFAEDKNAPFVTLTINAGAFQETPIENLDLTHARINVLEKLFEDNNVDLKTVKMSKWVNTLNTNALANCIQLNSVDFSNSTKLTTLKAGSLSNTVVKNYDFSKCYELNTWSTAYTSYLNFTTGEKPFVNATTTTNKNLQTVTLPMHNATLACPVDNIDKVFANCEKLTKVINLEVSQVTTLVDQAFEKCISLESLTLPKVLANVNGAPFDGCVKLETLTFKGDTGVTIGDGTISIFGTNADALAALKTLTIEGDYTGTVKAAALNTVTGLSTITISKDKIFSGTIEAGAIKLAENVNATVEFGDVTGTVNTIAGPVGIYKSTLTVNKFNVTAAATAAWVSNVIDVATVNGNVDKASVLTALGQAEKIVFNKDINVALAAPAAPNLVLTTVDFNGKLGNGATADIIPATVFDENNAPILASVTYKPATAPTAAIFAIDAFQTVSVGAAAKVTLYTTYEVAVDLYGDSEANLYNIIFKYEDKDPVLAALPVYGKVGTEFYYGKKSLDATKEYKFPKVTEKGEQVVVYSAFVDEADNTIYMDPLAIEDGYYYIPSATPTATYSQAVIVRVKNPQTTTTSAEINYVEETTGKSTMRYDKAGNIVNDLKNSLILYSSDYIGTNYVGKSLYSMKNPVNEGKLVWGAVSFDSYLPKNSVFVECNESAAARLNIVWLDGTEDVDGIINHIGDKQADGAIYNLNGVRVQKAQKGIFIINGKKVVK